MPRYGSWPTYSMSDHGAVLAQCIAQIGYVQGARWPFAMHAHGGRHADRLAVGKTLGRDPRRRHRFMLGGQTTSGHQKSLTFHRHKIVVGDIVVVVEQPLQPGLFAGMQFDRPSRAGDGERTAGAQLSAPCWPFWPLWPETPR